MTDHAHIFQINLSQGGVPKNAVRQGEVTEVGLVSDVQRDKRYHGGPMRALCLYPLELIVQLQREGNPIYPGSIGENITTVGLDFATLQVGDRLQLGAVVVEITDYAVPCSKIKGSFKNEKIGRVSAKTHPGESRVYVKILQTGVITVGDAIAVVGSDV